MAAGYHATKFALEGLSDTLRNEVRQFGIKVVVIEPGGIKTEWGGIAADSMVRISGHTAYADTVNKLMKLLKGAEDKGSDPIVIADLIKKAIEAKNPKAPVLRWLFCRPGFIFQEDFIR